MEKQLHKYEYRGDLFSAPRPDSENRTPSYGVRSINQYRCTKCGDTCDRIEAQSKLDRGEECCPPRQS
jgi:hypothetical protein